jgi:hypothetical protein
MANFMYRQVLVSSFASSASQPLEQPACLFETAVGGCPDQLGQAANLLQRVSFGDTFGAEHHLDIEAGRPQPPLDSLGRTGEDGRSQDHKAAVAQVGHEDVEHPVEYPHGRVHELVYRRADDEDHGVGAPEHARISGELEPAAWEQLVEKLFRTVLQERDAARPDLLDLGRVDVVDANPVTAVRKRQRKRQAHVAAAADDDDVQGVHGGQIMMASPVTPSLP